jgi:hypothetical protein
MTITKGKSMRILTAIILLAALAALSQDFYPRPAGLDTGRYLVPEDLEYRGAFRLPADRAGSVQGFTYLADAMTYSPHGDTAQDGYPGALVLAGHTRESMVAKIDIPAPVVSKTLADLPRARVLQPFVQFGIMPPNPGTRVMALEEVGDTTYVAMGDSYLPAPYGGQKMMGWGPSDLSRFTAMRPVGPDRVDCYGDYLFQVPGWWSARYAPGRFLAMGRHRWGDLCGQGPAIFVMNPHADPADTLQPLTAHPVLRYLPRVNNQPTGPMANYSHGGDYYAGAAFLESGHKSAVVLTGHKGLSGGIYGTFCNVQGFHDTAGYRPYFIFYSPDDLGRVALGTLEGHRPQPYAGQDVNALLVPSNARPCDNNYIAALAYDRERNLLYGAQKRPGENQLIHVWKVRDYGPRAPADVQPPRDSVAPPADTTRPPVPVDSGTCRPDTVVRADSSALAAARDSLAGALRTLHDLSRQLVEGHSEAAALQASLRSTRDSLQAARTWPDTVSVRSFLQRRLGHPVGSVSVGVE